MLGARRKVFGMQVTPREPPYTPVFCDKNQWAAVTTLASTVTPTTTCFLKYCPDAPQ